MNRIESVSNLTTKSMESEIREVKAKSAYRLQHNQSIQEKEAFWKKQSDLLSWFKKPTEILTKTGDFTYDWFKDGELNTCYLVLDFHIEQGRGEQLALIYDSPVTNTIKKYTYNELKRQVAKFAGGLISKGISKGDTVIIYMPMIPEAAIAMLACARIGAIHSVVFGGFAPHELAIRIDDALPRAIITASYGIEVDKKIAYKPLVDEAIEEATFKPKFTILFDRFNDHQEIYDDQTLDFQTLLEQSAEVGCETMKSTDPLYVLYTSGTTGKPKGIVRDHGGHATALRFSMENVYGLKAGEVFWAASDVGWVVGHSYIVYGPLINGSTTVLFEGKPVKTPDASVFWRIIEEHKVNVMFTAPTAIRAIKKEDNLGEMITNFDISSLKKLFLAGERCDTSTFEWISDLIEKPVVDHWWQTESGWPMLGTMSGEIELTSKPGSAGLPILGFDVQILSEDGKHLPANHEGLVALKLPLPPGCLSTLWKNGQGYIDSYLSQHEGYYIAGDSGYFDQDGYFYIMGRVDDVINVSGHRLSTGEMEEIVASHPAIAECAVVGIHDELRGQIPVGLVVLKDRFELEEDNLEKDLIALIRHQIGAVAVFKHVVLVKRLPKTRSGKILRKTIRNIADGANFQIPSTIDDPLIIDEIKDAFLHRKIGDAFMK